MTDITFINKETGKFFFEAYVKKEHKDILCNSSYSEDDIAEIEQDWRTWAQEFYYEVGDDLSEREALEQWYHFLSENDTAKTDTLEEFLENNSVKSSIGASATERLIEYEKFYVWIDEGDDTALIWKNE